MNISTNIDIGQVLIGGLISIITYFLKRMIDRIESRLDTHDTTLANLANGLTRLAALLERRDLESPMRSRR